MNQNSKKKPRERRHSWEHPMELRRTVSDFFSQNDRDITAKPDDESKRRRSQTSISFEDSGSLHKVKRQRPSDLKRSRRPSAGGTRRPSVLDTHDASVELRVQREGLRNVLADELEPDSGRVRRSQLTVPARADQSKMLVDPSPGPRIVDDPRLQATAAEVMQTVKTALQTVGQRGETALLQNSSITVADFKSANQISRLRR